MTPDKVTINITHPTNPSDTITAAVSAAATPQFLVDQMVKQGWLAKPAGVAQYKLRNAKTGVQLLDDQSLATAGITNGTDLVVDPTVTGAGGE